MNWHYAVDEDRKGPVDETTISTLIGSGVVTRDTLVWKQGMAGWTEASKTELARYFAESSPYAPPRATVEPQLERTSGAPIPRREALAVVLLTLFTCGIYGLYLLYQWAGEINTASGTQKHNPTLVLVLSILTCGIAGIVFHILFAFDVEKLTEREGIPDRQTSLGGLVTGIVLGGLVLSLIGLPVGLVTTPLAYWLLQAELNKLAG